MANKKLWNTTYRYWANGMNLSVYLFHAKKIFFVLNKKGLRGIGWQNFMGLFTGLHHVCIKGYSTYYYTTHSSKNSLWPDSIINRYHDVDW